MSWYRIIPVESITWRIDATFFADNLRRLWPQISIDSTPTPSIALSWEITWEPASPSLGLKPFVAGTLSQDLHNVFITGDFEACVSFALYYRTLVPFEYRLLFQDEPLTTQVELSTETTKAQIIKSFEPSLTPIQWKILHILKNSGGKTQLVSVIDMLRVDFASMTHGDFLEQADEAMNALWGHNIISSPGARWVFPTPKEIKGILSSAEFRSVEFSLTDKGWRALKAKQQ